MYKFLPVLCCFFSALTLVSAQDVPAKSALKPCGSPVGIDPWLIQYQTAAVSVADRSEDTLYAGMQIHLLAKDNGSGRMSVDKLLDAFCRLNSDFAPSNIRWYFKNPWNLVNHTAWFDHNDIPAGIDMMLTNNYPDALNSYFVSDPAGNCGYNLPYGGVAISHGCAAPTDHTWAHEVGHALSLPHPFIGWEGKTYNYNNPTPDTLTYDYTYFHDTLETTVPAPLDTALVEYLDGSNCNLAADLFCDTKADYISKRWNCDAQGLSTIKQKDPAGNDFYSDGSLYMSYSNDECQNRFSPDQIAAMRANLLSEKIAWLGPAVPQGQITGVATPLEPINNTLTPADGVLLHWAAVPNATHYYVLVSQLASFALHNFEAVVTDTFAVTGMLPANKKMYWRVRPFNAWSTCTPGSPAATFMTAPVTAVSETETGVWECFPSLTAGATPIYIVTSGQTRNSTVQCRLFQASGNIVWEDTQSINAGANHLILPDVPESPGLYLLVVQEEGMSRVFKITVVK